MAKQQQTGGGYYFTPQSVTTQVDWSEISKQVTDTLLTENQARQDRRQDIEDATTAEINRLQETMHSDHIETNEMANSYASNATEAMMIAKNQVMNGDRSQREYNLIKNNLMTGSKNMGTLVKSFNEDYAEWQRRTDAGENIASIEAWLAKKYYGFSQFGNVDGASKPYINPMTGEVSMGIMRLNDKGVLEMSSNKSEYASVLSLLGRNKARYTHYDPVASSKQYVGTLGEQINVIAKGNIQKRNDLLQGKGIYDPVNAELLATLKRYSKAELAYSPNFAAVLNDNIQDIPLDANGKYDPVNGTPTPFDYTFDPDEAKTSDHWILMTNDSFPVPVMDNVPQAQMDMYEDFQIKTMLSQVKKEETYLTPKTSRATSSAEMEHAEGLKQAGNVVDYLYTAITAKDSAAGKGALSALSQINPDKKYSNYKKTKDAISFSVSRLSRNPETNTMEWGRPENVVIPLGSEDVGADNNITFTPLSVKEIIKNALPAFTDYSAYVNLDNYNLQTEGTNTQGEKVMIDMIPSETTYRGGRQAHTIVPWDNIKEKRFGTNWDKVDQVFQTDFTESQGKTPKAMGEAMARRLNEVIFTNKNIGEFADDVRISSTDSGRLIEKVELSDGRVVEFQTMLGKYDEDNVLERNSEDKARLQAINKLIYNLLVTGAAPSMKVLEQKIEQISPESSVLKSQKLD